MSETCPKHLLDGHCRRGRVDRHGHVLVVTERGNGSGVFSLNKSYYFHRFNQAIFTTFSQVANNLTAEDYPRRFWMYSQVIYLRSKAWNFLSKIFYHSAEVNRFGMQLTVFGDLHSIKPA